MITKDFVKASERLNLNDNDYKVFELQEKQRQQKRLLQRYDNLKRQLNAVNKQIEENFKSCVNWK